MVMRIVSVIIVIIMSLVVIQLMFHIFQAPTVFLDRVFMNPWENVESQKKLADFLNTK